MYIYIYRVVRRSTENSVTTRIRICTEYLFTIDITNILCLISIYIIDIKKVYIYIYIYIYIHVVNNGLDNYKTIYRTTVNIIISIIINIVICHIVNV